MRRACNIVVLAGMCLAWGGCFTATKVTIERLEPPASDVQGINVIAVLPFSDRGGDDKRGAAVSSHLSAVLAKTGRYRVMKTDQIAKRLGERGIVYSYPPDAAAVRAIGSALEIDAVMYGEIEKFQYNEESGITKVKERVWTGDYVRDSRGNTISDSAETGEAIPRKRYEKRVVEKNRLKRYAVLDLHVRLADASMGNVICAASESESGSWEGTGSDEIAQMPSKDIILDLLVDRATKKFIRRIAPHPVEESRDLEWGVFHVTALGVELAKNNLWDEAMEKWLQSTKAKPDDPAAYYNLGVAFERQGRFDLAYKAYQNALARNPQSARYIKAVAQIQKLMEEMQ